MKLEIAIETIKQYPFSIVATEEFASQDGKYAAVPSGLHPEVQGWLKQKYSSGIYTHQAKALDAFLRGEDVGLMTPTASGKSAIFQAAAAHLIKSKPDSRVLALFPLVALAKDQERSWKQVEEATGIKVGLIHGGVAVKTRETILAGCDVILATPDVIHAWFMSRLNEPLVCAFREKLGLLILDETHVYDGVFGANMAFFLARIRACGPNFRTICASATLGEPEVFLSTLVGRAPVIIGKDGHGTKVAGKALVALRYASDDKESLAAAIKALAASHNGQTLVFIDNRSETDFIAQLIADDGFENPEWLAYRAGYEEMDRDRIQTALTNATLKGVVATSALEAGIDIGSVELVVMVGKPQKMRSFWQRFGRLRNEIEGCAVILDADWPQSEQAFCEWLKTPVEKNQLYLDNETLQLYSALCVNHESAATGAEYDIDAFSHLPESFENARHLAAHPEESFEERHQLILAQAGADSPQRIFTLRSFERRYEVKVADCEMLNLGHLSLSQVFQESFPGAVYRYMNRAYRVIFVDHGNQRVVTRAINSKTRQRTYPTRVQCAYSDFTRSVRVMASENLVVADVPMNLREQIIGFTQRVGRRSENFVYGTSHTGRALMRTIPTTGVAIVGPDLSEEAIEALSTAYCGLEGIHSADLAVARLRWNSAASGIPIPSRVIQGWAIADKTSGSLRLSSKLVSRWNEVVDLAQDDTNDPVVKDELKGLIQLSADLVELHIDGANATKPENLIAIVAPGSVALRVNGGDEREVVVEDYLFHPQFGWSYRLAQQGGVTTLVKSSLVIPIAGISATAWFNPAEMKIVMPLAA